MAINEPLGGAYDNPLKTIRYAAMFAILREKCDCRSQSIVQRRVAFFQFQRDRQWIGADGHRPGNSAYPEHSSGCEDQNECKTAAQWGQVKPGIQTASKSNAAGYERGERE
jgi:hypothetical protein